MSFFDRFTSRKGKAEPKKSATVDVAQKKAFANVPSGKEDGPAKKTSEKKGTETKSVEKPVKETTHQAYRLLLRPVVTEKSTRLAQLSQYVFETAADATKNDIRQAVYHVYGIKPVAVNMVHLPGKIVRYGRTYGRQTTKRKAVVTLPTGKTIDVSTS
ncbi:MAG: 50S ribosomal protein L23 [Candidatus Kerfeldbacteria bacterium]|nr:50S ribosomal protein L23 [Candidatus Kerfeldbacteria bacterium]